MDPFCYETLTQEQRLYLSSFAKHPGFIVLKKMMEDACRQATTAVIKLNPDDKDFDIKLKNRQMTARIVNDDLRYSYQINRHAFKRRSSSRRARRVR